MTTPKIEPSDAAHEILNYIQACVDIGETHPEAHKINDIIARHAAPVMARMEAGIAELNDMIDDSHRRERVLLREITELKAEVERFRKLLWIRHGCDFLSLYGDDGEMQCNQCMIDFKRMSAEDIEDKWMTDNLKAWEEAHGPVFPQTEATDE